MAANQEQGNSLRGSFLAASLVLAMVSACASARAGEASRGSEFRLLELDGRKARWTLPAKGLPATVSYSFLTQPAQFPGARNCDAMLPPEAALGPSHISAADFRREVRAAFSTWENAANIKFVETSSIAEAGILIGADAKARGRAFTNVALKDAAPGAPTAAVGAIRQSLICLNPRRPWKVGFDGNLDIYDVRFTVTHEIGHAIGLDHPSPEGQLMSFRYVESAHGLQPGDIAGAVALYGTRNAAPMPDGGVAAAMAASANRRVLASPAAGIPAFGLGEPRPGKAR